MNRILKLSILLAALLGAMGAARAQMSPLPGFPPGTFQNRAALDAGGVAAYAGPGDVVGGAFMWGSCARVYSLAKASTSTSMCDLVQGPSGASPGTAVGTLRGSATGFVDLTGYFAGSVTPATACGLITGGCTVAKVYDQIGGTAGWSNATNSQQPALVFSSLNGLPGMVGVSANITNMLGTALVADIPVPYFYASVYKKTGTAAESVTIGYNGSDSSMGTGVSANTAQIKGSLSTAFTATAADNTFHSQIGLANGASPNSVLNIDGTETTGSTDANNIPTGAPPRILRGNGCCSIDGTVMEVGQWNANISGPNRTALNSNMHGANGYNF
ncbi:hypothetical protein [Bradyrhizobium lablabi]|uniref:hypothetical protein n=1 Tax=Bradyrhizobium lablabi TaxID=722472 RepID=UPI00090AD450|nr:hypothetical protein [Bradyrhizobium lablabi]SHM37335.1 hypothetical protein SAMN05444321_6136 [Bradyrhizobium lablabi]